MTQTTEGPAKWSCHCRGSSTAVMCILASQLREALIPLRSISSQSGRQWWSSRKQRRTNAAEKVRWYPASRIQKVGPDKPRGEQRKSKRQEKWWQDSVSDQTALYYFLRSCCIANGQGGRDVSTLLEFRHGDIPRGDIPWFRLLWQLLQGKIQETERRHLLFSVCEFFRGWRVRTRSFMHCRATNSLCGKWVDNQRKQLCLQTPTLKVRSEFLGHVAYRRNHRIWYTHWEN